MSDKPRSGTRFGTDSDASDLYAGGENNDYVTELSEEGDDDDGKSKGKASSSEGGVRQKQRTFTVQDAFDETKGQEIDPFAQHNKGRVIAEREDEYHARRMNRIISPPRADPFAMDASGDGENKNVRSYKDAMRETQLGRDEAAIKRNIEKKLKEEAEQKKKDGADKEGKGTKRGRWDAGPGESEEEKPSKRAKPADWDGSTDSSSSSGKSGSNWDVEATPRNESGSVSETPGRRNSRWDATPQTMSGSGMDLSGGATPSASMMTPGGKNKRSRWDETPTNAPGGQLGLGGATPMGQQAGMFTPSREQLAAMTPEQTQSIR